MMGLDKKSIEFIKSVFDKSSFKTLILELRNKVKNCNNGLPHTYDKELETEESEEVWSKGISKICKIYSIPNHLQEAVEYYYFHNEVDSYMEAMASYPSLSVYGASLVLRRNNLRGKVLLEIYPNATKTNVIDFINKSWYLIQRNFSNINKNSPPRRIKTRPKRGRNMRVALLVEQKILKADGGFGRVELEHYLKQNPPKYGISDLERLNSLGFNLPRSAEGRAKIYKEIMKLKKS